MGIVYHIVDQFSDRLTLGEGRGGREKKRKGKKSECIRNNKPITSIDDN